MTTLLMQRSGPWSCLLWKDFRQVSPTLIAVTLGGLAMQLLLVAAVIWGDENQELGSLAPVIACVAPVLFAIGACGMLVGHERQSGSWEWSSSLPVSWGYALSSKLLVSLSGAVFIAMLLAIVPVTLLLVGHLVIENTSLVMVYVSGMTLIALLEVVAYFFIATLLMRETLTALVIAGLGLCIGQVAIPALALAIASDRLIRWGLTPDFANTLISYSASFGILVFGMFAMLVTFRWRWTTGQRSSFLMRANATAAAAPTAAYVYSTQNSPGSWRVLLKLALTSSFWLRLSAVAAASLLMFGLEPITSSWGFGLALGSGLLGLSAFEGDQAQQRYRFLADRGLAPWKLVVSRLGIASAWMFGLWCGCLVLPITSPMALPITIAQAERMIMTIVLSSLAFLVSALATICLRKPVVAATATFVVFAVGLGSYVYAIEYAVERSKLVGVWLDQDALFGLTLFWSPMAMLVLLVAIFRAARRWMVFDGLHLPRLFLVAVLLAWVTPFVSIYVTLHGPLWR
jgi:hypothetical protein